ncbi:MAG: HD domain-containing protein [Paludibacteraceae bacterium]|nr:HD domain-containing protein [Paludibacteraceae bacterium]
MFRATNKNKIINDPVLGFITIPNELIYELVQHPLFQRLTRIKQLGLANVVYPGAQHTRFQHSLGAMHLVGEAVKQLRLKGQVITAAEENGVLAAMLLHDIGHGPFSHVLENTLIENVSHEELSLKMMEAINDEMGGRLGLAIKIFKDEYEKRFLHQLISSQLDMDRMDYLCRDCFFTGVMEGSIGAARIIKMLNVSDDKLVVEAKGIYSIENFLVARRFMYWQVYLHKTSVAAEKMLVNILRRAKELVKCGVDLFATPALKYFLENDVDANSFDTDYVLKRYEELDDVDVMSAVKVWMKADDVVLRELSKGFIERRFFKTVTGDDISLYNEENMKRQYAERFGIDESLARYFYVEEVVRSNTYNPDGANIMIMYGDGRLDDVAHASDMMNVDMMREMIEKRYLFYMPIFK